MDIKQILDRRPVLHGTADGQRVDMGIASEVLNFLLEHAPEGGASLETGCGLSTVLFAHRSSRHTAISPAGQEFKDLLDFCRANGVKTDGLELIEGKSEYVLPTLKPEPLDVVLIDGRHGFPAPFIDWFYTAGRLKLGGLLVVDDTWLWAPMVLRDLLAEQPQWESLGQVGGRSAVFRKTGEGSEWGDWNDQPYSYRNGHLRLTPQGVDVVMPEPPSLAERLARHVSRGEWRALGQKALGRLCGGGGR